MNLEIDNNRHVGDAATEIQTSQSPTIVFVGDSRHPAEPRQTIPPADIERAFVESVTQFLGKLSPNTSLKSQLLDREAQAIRNRDRQTAAAGGFSETIRELQAQLADPNLSPNEKNQLIQKNKQLESRREIRLGLRGAHKGIGEKAYQFRRTGKKYGPALTTTTPTKLYHLDDNYGAPSKNRTATKSLAALAGISGTLPLQGIDTRLQTNPMGLSDGTAFVINHQLPTAIEQQSSSEQATENRAVEFFSSTSY